MSAPDTWLDLPADTSYGLGNLPYGVFAPSGGPPRVGVRVGEQVLDLAASAAAAGLQAAAVWQAPSLNPFLAQGHSSWDAGRSWIVEMLTSPARRAGVEPHLHDLAEVTLHLPIEVADYVDFYASQDHATNLGTFLRPDDEPLPPSWTRLPISYHGRAGTVVVSGTDVVRPCGQRRFGDDVDFGPSRRLDLEAEVGFVLGGPTPLGTSVPVDQAAEHLLGVALLNDWSARDIQAWETVPLGPHLGKSFASSLGAWVTPMAALTDARIPLGQQDSRLQDYLRGHDLYGLDLRLEVAINGTVVSHPPYGLTYWSPTQLLAHLTVNGARVRAGDLVASGTISGPRPDERGSLIELSWDGTQPITLDDGSTRTFLEDGDTVTITGWAPGPDGTRIGLGDVTGTIQPPATVTRR